MRTRRRVHCSLIRPIGLQERVGRRVALYPVNQEEGTLQAQNGDFYVAYEKGRRHQILHTEILNFEDGLYLVDLIER